MRATKPEPSELAGRRPRSPSSSSASRPPPCRGGDAWRVALRPTFRPRRWFLSLARACPAPIPTDRLTTADCSEACVRTDVHESKDRAKDASPGACDDFSSSRRVRPLAAAADDVPLLGVLRTSVVIGAPVCSGGSHYTLTDRPRPSFRRCSAKNTAFPKIGMPSTVPTRRSSLTAEGLIPPAFVPVSRSRRPHVLP